MFRECILVYCYKLNAFMAVAIPPQRSACHAEDQSHCLSLYKAAIYGSMTSCFVPILRSMRLWQETKLNSSMAGVITGYDRNEQESRLGNNITLLPWQTTPAATIVTNTIVVLHHGCCVT